MEQELCARAEVFGDEVEVKLTLGEKDIGTLRVGVADYPTLKALLNVGADLMNMKFDYELIVGKERWTQ